MLRHRRFYCVAELNEAIVELRDRINNRPFRKREGTRASLFAELDRPALQPLPQQRYQLAEWKKVRANIDYHVEVDRHFYSVPYQLVGQQLEARFTVSTVEIFHHSVRVASHPRSSAAYRHTTVAEHRPKSHQAHLEWTPSRLIHWAESVGPATAQVITNILETKPHPEMGYRSCLGILCLAKTYSAERLEAASQRALQLQAFSYQSLHSILKNSLDRQILLEPDNKQAGPRHETSAALTITIHQAHPLCRSTASRKELTMLNQPTLEKLQIMKLHGMGDAIRAQLETTNTSDLSFEERFALLVDQQWLWKENRALRRRLRAAKLKERGVVEDIDYQHPRGLDRKLMRTLANCEWVRQHHDLLLIGPTGIGKTWLGCALAQKACREVASPSCTSEPTSYSAILPSRMSTEASAGCCIDILVLDDFAMTPLKDSERRDFLELCDDRYERRSMILTSQLPLAHWREQIEDPTLADSILDRLVHNAYRIESTANRFARSADANRRLSRERGFYQTEVGQGARIVAALAPHPLPAEFTKTS